MYLTAGDFFTAIAGETVDFDTGQGLVKLRGLTVAEVKVMQARAEKAKKEEDNASGIDTLPLLVAHGLVEPELSESDVQRIVDNGSFSLVSAMAQRVMALSGMTDDAKKREALDS
jgi:hypothetical protein